MSDFRYTTDLDVRLRDLDPMGHVNNGVYATYLEQARERYFADVVGKGLLDPLNTVTVRQTIEYELPVDSTVERVELAVRAADVGDSSITLAYEVRTEAGLAATGETVQVVYEMDASESRPVPDPWRSRIAEFEDDA